MTQIKKMHRMSDGVQVYPQTHTKAVIDDNGYTAESRLQAMQDEINTAQLEVGAVPSDLTPTEESSHWVTSGGVLNAFKTSFGELLANETLNNSSFSVVKCNIYDGKWNDVNNASRKSIFVPLNTGFVYKVTSGGTVYYAVVTSTTVTSGATPAFAPGYTNRVSLPQDSTVNIIGTDGQYLWIREDDSLNFIIVKSYNVLQGSVVDGSVQAKSKMLVSSDGIYESLINDKVFFDEKIAGFEDITSTSQTDASILTVTLDTVNQVIKFDGTGTYKASKFAVFYISNQNLISGEKYKATFSYTASLNSGFDGWVACYNSGGTKLAEAYANASSGTLSYIFTSDGNAIYFRTKSASIGSTGKYIYLSNFKIVLYDEGIKTLPILTYETDSLLNEVFESELFSEATKTSTYVGEKIPTIGKTRRIGSKYIMSNSGCQGGAAYGDYWFQFTDSHSSVSIYNLATASLHSTVSLTSNSAHHCNNACFGPLFYDSNDDFPLLYTSYSETDTYNNIQVWRVQLANDTFTIEQVQSINLPTGTSSNIWHKGQAYIDCELKSLWYQTVSGGHAIFSRFSIPDPSISEVTLTESDVKDSFTTITDTNRQGGVVKNGILYLLNGVPSWGTYTTLNVYDLWGKRLINIVDIYYSLGLTREFEGCGIHNNKLVAATNGGGIYYLYF